MKERKSKLFISYTVRDGKVNREFLSTLESSLNSLYEVYIDMIHNDSINKQQRVMTELKTSDFLILIKTDKIDKSKWVKKEIRTARKQEIPICEFEFIDLIKNKFQPILAYIRNSSLIAQQ